MDPFKPFNSKVEDSIEVDGTLVFRNVRLSYPHIFRPFSQQGGEPRFSMAGIANLPAEQRQKMVEIIRALIKRRLGEKGNIPADRWFLRNGDDTGKAENAGCLVFNASEKPDNRPAVYNRFGVTTASEAEVYAGCMVDAIIRPWIQDNSFGKRVNASLVAVKFVGDNTPFGAPPVDVASVFGVAAGQELPAPEPEGLVDDGNWSAPTDRDAPPADGDKLDNPFA